MRSLPGIGRAEITTQSSLRTFRNGCRCAANRVNADIGSPWLPAVSSSSLAGAIRSTSASGMTIPSGTFRKPSSRAVLKFCCRLRPTIAMRRSNCAAMRTRCCMRWMFDAKFATTMRPGASLKMRSNASWRSRSEPEWPLRSELVESLRRSKTPASPSFRNRSMLVGRPSGGAGSSLKSLV